MQVACRLLRLIFIGAILCPMVGAAQFGLFTYELEGGTVKITGYPKDAVGAVVIPQSIDGVPVTVIDRSAFHQCSKLTSIVIPEGVASIEYQAFSFCSSVESFELPTSLTNIARWAFRGCFKLGSVEIPPNVTTVGSEAFDSCPALRFVTIPESVSFIGLNAFSAGQALERIDVAAENLSFGSVEGVLFDLDEKVLLRCPPAKTGEFAVPAGIKHVGDYAFTSSKLRALSFPEGLETIGYRAFWSSNSLTRMDLPASLTQIRSGAFLLSTIVEGFTVHEDNLYFSSHEGSLFNKERDEILRYVRVGSEEGVVTVPDGVHTIGEFAFSFIGMTELKVSSSVKTIGRHAFTYNRQLRKVDLPEGVTIIGYGAFNDCGALERIDLPESLTSIGDFAFTFCYSLKSARIPASVTRLGSYSFSSCSSLKSVVFMGNAPELGQHSFRGTAGGFKLYHFNTGTGFPAPLWEGYSTVNLGAYSPKAPWLLSWGLPHDVSLDTEWNGAGGSLLMAYALNRNPTNVSFSPPPRAEMEQGRMRMRYFSRAEGVEYYLESSENLVEWTADGITSSSKDAYGFVEVSVDSVAPAKFLRIGVRYIHE